jgi:hypothetical protein
MNVGVLVSAIIGGALGGVELEDDVSVGMEIETGAWIGVKLEEGVYVELDESNSSFPELGASQQADRMRGNMIKDIQVCFKMTSLFKNNQ